MEQTMQNVLHIQANEPAEAEMQAIFLCMDCLSRLKEEDRRLRGYIIDCHFNLRDALRVDEIKAAYCNIIQIIEDILGDAQEVILTSNADLKCTYTCNIIINF